MPWLELIQKSWTYGIPELLGLAKCKQNRHCDRPFASLIFDVASLAMISQNNQNQSLQIMQVLQVNVLEAKNQLSHLIRLAQAGDQVIIANRGTPVAQLIPIIPIHATAPAPDRSFVKWLASNPMPAYAHRSAREIDAAISEERSVWD